CMSLEVRFYFHAEDGIRDFHVTGVQTCALPISHHLLQRGELFRYAEGEVERSIQLDAVQVQGAKGGLARRGQRKDDQTGNGMARSEERRVGRQRKGGGWEEL